MVWGTASARRPAPAADMIPGSPPPMVECARCETPAVMFTASACCSGGVGAPDAALPKGWALVDGRPHCPDCRRGPSVLFRAPRPAASSRALRAVGRPKERSRYQAWRIGHEVALGQAAIQIRAVAEPTGGRDEAVSFLMDVHGIDELIIELSAIRAELVGKPS